MRLQVCICTVSSQFRNSSNVLLASNLKAVFAHAGKRLAFLRLIYYRDVDVFCLD